MAILDLELIMLKFGLFVGLKSTQDAICFRALLTFGTIASHLTFRVVRRPLSAPDKVGVGLSQVLSGPKSVWLGIKASMNL